MNVGTKTALAIVFTLGVIHLLLLIGGMITGTPGSGGGLLTHGPMGGRDAMWIPVFFWAWIPTTIMLAIGALLIWVSFVYPHKKKPSNPSPSDTSHSEAIGLK